MLFRSPSDSEGNNKTDCENIKKSEKCDNIEEIISTKEENITNNEKNAIDSNGRNVVTDRPLSMNSGGLRSYIQSALQRDFSTVLLPNLDHEKVQDPSRASSVGK